MKILLIFLVSILFTNNLLAEYLYQNQFKEFYSIDYGIDCKFLEFDNNGIIINNLYNGSYDPNLLPFINLNEKDEISTIQLFASNQQGEFNLKSLNKFGIVKVLVAANYFTLADFNVSKDIPVFNGIVNYRQKQSSFNQYNLYGKISLEDKQSKVSAEYQFNNRLNNIPFSTYLDDSVFFNNNFKLENFAKLNIQTDIGRNELLVGDFYFINTKHNKKLFLDTNFTQRNPISPENNFLSNTYGLKLKVIFDSKNSLLDEIEFDYSKNETHFEYLKNLGAQPVQSENISLNIDKMIKPFRNNDFKFKFNLNYYISRIQNMNLESDNRYSGFDFNLDLNKELDSNIVTSYVLNLHHKMPSMDNFLFDEGIAQLKENALIKNILKTSYEKDFQIFSIELYYLIGSNLNSYKINFSDKNAPSFEQDCYGLNFIYKLKGKRLSAGLNYNYNSTKLNHNDYLNLLIAPAHSLLIELGYKFSFDLELLCNFNYYSERENFIAKNKFTLDSYYKLDFYLSQRIFNQNKMFLQLKNITDVYYEFMHGYPAPGILFGIGFDFVL